VQSHTVGGTLSGLAAGASVVLHNNGGDALSLSSNGGFTFATPLSGGAAYTVTVSVQPNNQTCAVANGSGIVSSANVNTVAVTCPNGPTGAKRWGTAAPVSVRPQQEFLPRVAFDASGNGVAVWESVRVTGITHDIAFSRYTESGWSAPDVIPLLSPTPVNSFYENSRNPDIAVDPSGNAIAVWRQGGDTQLEFNIWSSRYTPGVGWSQRERISDTSLTASDPQIAFDGNGNALAVWRSSAGIQYNRYKVGSGWGPTATPRFVSAFGANAREPRLAVNANGDAMAVWTQDDDLIGNRLDLWSSRFVVATQTWGAPQPVETDNSGSIFYAKQVVIDPAGAATAVWSQYDGTRLHVLANRHVAGAWGVGAAIETDNTGPGTNAYDPKTTVDGNGNILAMWRQIFYEDDPDDETDGPVSVGSYVCARFTPEAGWGAPVRMGSYPGYRNPSSDYDIVSTPAGNAVAVWSLFVQTDPEISFGPMTLFSNRYTVGSGWGAPETIGTGLVEAGNGVGDAVVSSAIDADGNALVVWSGASSTQDNDILFNRLK
jgi:hypothetical protein